MTRAAYSITANSPYPSSVAARVLSEALEAPWAKGSSEITTTPRRASSRAMLACVSLERWKPGTTTTSGAGRSAVAVRGRKRSAAIHWPFRAGSTSP